MQYKNKRTVLLYMLVFLLVSLIGMLNAGHPLFNNFSRIFYGGIIVVWAMTVLRRIIEPQIKALLLENAVLLLLLILFHALRFQFVQEHGTVHRFMWYCYYIPICFLPVISLKLSLRCGRSENVKISPLWDLFLLPSIVLSILILSNDKHHLAFSFMDPVGKGYDFYAYGPIYYITMVWIALVVVATAVITIIRFASKPVRKDSWAYYVVLLTSAYFLLTDYFDVAPVINDIQFLSPMETFSIFIVCGWEACIQTCLLPSNSGYRYFFENSGLIAKITDSEGRVKVISKGADFDWDNENYHILVRDVWGGRLSYAEDISYITESNKELAVLSENLSEENALQEAENKLKEDRVQTSVMNRLYDDITDFSDEKVKEIENLFVGANDDSEFKENLEKACILASYIKRRGNLYLLGQENDQYDFNDLFLSLKESLDYFSLGGALVYLSAEHTEPIGKNLVLAAYDSLELFLESLSGRTKSLLVNLDSVGTVLALRLMFDSSISDEEIIDIKAQIEARFYASCKESLGEEDSRIVSCIFQGDQDDAGHDENEAGGREACA